jgi:protein-S-isoprenylcysteine O-methyltransferase Ste14
MPEITPNVQFQPPKLLPPHYLLIALVLMIGCLWLPVSDFLPQDWRWLGAPFALGGVAIAGLAARQFKVAETNIIPLTKSSELVINGVFSFTRNPMYLGMMLLLFGVALMVNVWIAWVFLPIFFTIIRTQFIAKEEQLMIQTFGDEYLEYRDAVRRWL